MTFWCQTGVLTARMVSIIMETPDCSLNSNPEEQMPIGVRAIY